MVSKILYFHPYLGKISNLTNIFQRGWNHQLGHHFWLEKMWSCLKCFGVFFFVILDVDCGCWTKNRGVYPPKWMVKIMENPIKMDDLGIPLFLETPKTNTAPYSGCWLWIYRFYYGSFFFRPSSPVGTTKHGLNWMVIDSPWGAVNRSRRNSCDQWSPCFLWWCDWKMVVPLGWRAPRYLTPARSPLKEDWDPINTHVI